MGKVVASIAESLSQAHGRLLADLRKLEEEAADAAKGTLAELRATLQATRAHVAEHFKFEEANGYMDTLRKREPRLERAIENLSEEHADLLRSLDALIENTRRGISAPRSIRERIRYWVGNMYSHERRENDLVQDAFDFDVGTGD